MPSKWRSPSYVFPACPASEFAHCNRSIAEAVNKKPELNTPAAQCQQFIGQIAKVGLKAVGRNKTTLAVPEWFDVIIAGVPCLTIMLTKSQHLIKAVVRYFDCTTIKEYPAWLYGAPGCTGHVHQV